MEHIIYRWDLDKTYLRTEFETVKGLIRTAFQSAEEKESVPGAPSLLKELQKDEANSVYFISGSPKQMRKVLEKKLRIDGINWTELVLKPNLQNLLHGRFHALREQIGYKLPVLLEDRVKSGQRNREVLFGDDAESDAYIYSLYADTIAGKVGEGTIEEIMDLARVPSANRKKSFHAVGRLEHSDAVGRIFIYLEKRSPPKGFDVYGSRVVPIYNYFQAVLILYREKLMGMTSVIRVILDLVFEHRTPPSVFANSFQDLLRRGVIDMSKSVEIIDGIRRNLNQKIIPLPQNFYEDLMAMLDALKEVENKDVAVSVAEPIDYVGLYIDQHRKLARQRKSMFDRLFG
ncbi:MAG: hypothetical protein M1491_08040 [Deltaproteobacteria bacterium]|nr:hypothetical protein [Deltaproteobacteria bacterium]MCL5277869.1 hypothetical protein [Deltaproteobacteria bacterium]